MCKHIVVDSTLYHKESLLDCFILLSFLQLMLPHHKLPALQNCADKSKIPKFSLPTFAALNKS